MLAQMSSGHFDLADALYLLAFVLFVLEAILTFVAQPAPKLSLVPLGLAALALALFVQ